MLSVVHRVGLQKRTGGKYYTRGEFVHVLEWVSNLISKGFILLDMFLNIKINHYGNSMERFLTVKKPKSKLLEPISSASYLPFSANHEKINFTE